MNDLIELLRQPLSESELEKMLHPETSHHSETDAYTALLNHFTQKNTDALIKCMHHFQSSLLHLNTIVIDPVTRLKLSMWPIRGPYSLYPRHVRASMLPKKETKY